MYVLFTLSAEWWSTERIVNGRIMMLDRFSFSQPPICLLSGDITEQTYKKKETEKNLAPTRLCCLIERELTVLMDFVRILI